MTSLISKYPCATRLHRNDLDPWARNSSARFGAYVSGCLTDDLNHVNYKPERSLVGKKTTSRVKARRETGDCSPLQECAATSRDQTAEYCTWADRNTSSRKKRLRSFGVRRSTGRPTTASRSSCMRASPMSPGSPPGSNSTKTSRSLSGRNRSVNTDPNRAKDCEFDFAGRTRRQIHDRVGYARTSMNDCIAHRKCPAERPNLHRASGRAALLWPCRSSSASGSLRRIVSSRRSSGG